MRKWTVKCDRCGKEILGNPMKLIAEYSARDDDIPVCSPMPEEIKNGLLEDCTRDYCEDCMKEIMTFARRNMDEITFVEEQKESEISKAVQSFNGQKLKKKMSAGQREKIEQLFARGFDEKEISQRLGIDLYIARYVIEQIKKAG